MELKNKKNIWQNKKILQTIYHDWYKKIVKDFSLAEGSNLEVGSGLGNFKNYYSNIITSDIINNSKLDHCFSAEKIPLADNSVSNIISIDTLHHLKDPIQFFHEAERILKPNGRIILLEPFPSFFSLIIYKIFHPEPFNFRVNYFPNKRFRIKSGMTLENDKKTQTANQAMPYLLFYKNKNKFLTEFPNFEIKKRQRLSFFLYPLSGGYTHKSLIPNFLVPVAKVIEFVLTPFQCLLAFRCYVVIEKCKKC